MDSFLKDTISIIKKTKFNKEETLFHIRGTRWLYGTIYVFGNGGSSATASHFSSDLISKRFKSFCLNDNTPIITAIANDFDYDEIFVEQLKEFDLDRKDLVIGITCSGRSKNIINAISYANKLSPTIVFTAFDAGEFLKNVKVNQLIHVPTNNIYMAEGIHSLLLHDLVNDL